MRQFFAQYWWLVVIVVLALGVGVARRRR